MRAPIFRAVLNSVLWMRTVYSPFVVYRLLGKKGLIMKDKKLRVDKAHIEGEIGFRSHKQGHTDTPDWPAFFEFARKHLK